MRWEAEISLPLRKRFEYNIRYSKGVEEDSDRMLFFGATELYKSMKCKIFIPCIGILLAFLWLSSCEPDLKEVQKVIPRDALNVETGKDVEILYSDSAVVRVRILSPTLLRYVDRNDPRQEFPDGVKIIFFDKDKKMQSILTSKYGMRYENKGKTILRDSVVWESVNFEHLETPELIWDEHSNTIYSNKFTKITKPGEILYGIGFKTNQELTNWQITGPEGRFNAGGLSKQIE